MTVHSQRKPTLTILQANLILASLAGSWCRRSDKHPGAQTLAEGLKALHLLIWYEKHNAPAAAKVTKRWRGPT